MNIVKMRYSLIGILIMFYHITFGQDNYHTVLQQSLSENFNLENGDWVFSDNEEENQGNSYNYGATDLIPLMVDNQDFTRVSNILNEEEGNFSYDSGWGIANTNSINQGDVCLLIINLRKTNNVNDLGKVTVNIQASDNSEFEEAVIIQLEEQWNQYLIPFQANKPYQAGELIAALSLAWEIQEIEIAGATMLNFGRQYNLVDLPLIIHNERYGGYKADAPWRAAAADRIEQNRKADLNIEISDMNDNPISDVRVSIEMIEHEFKWGTEIRLDRFPGNRLEDPVFQNRLLDIDGQGHTLNWVTPGASLKWPGIEEGWIGTFDEKVNALRWLKDNDFKIRFHTLVWPGWINAPFDIEENANDPQYIINRTNEWINFILTHPDLQNIFDECDVLNETTTNRDFEMSFSGYNSYVTGREYFVDVMNQVSNLVPDLPQVINDYITISSQQKKGEQYDFLKNTIQELIDNNTDLNGIGFQSHLNIFPNSIYEIEEILNDFTQYNVPLKITEFDFLDSRMDPELEATYLDDYLTMLFSIPEVDMFIFWGIWDGNHQFDSGNLFYEDWTPKPAARVFFNKVFDEWWTEESASTAANGIASFRPYKGRYQIKIEYQNEEIIDTISITEDNSISYTVDQSTPTYDEYQNPVIHIFPNPVANLLTIKSHIELIGIKIYTIDGSLVLEQENINSRDIKIDISSFQTGIFILEAQSGKKVFTKRVEFH